jgi:hypothetical protein
MHSSRRKLVANVTGCLMIFELRVPQSAKATTYWLSPESRDGKFAW